MPNILSLIHVRKPDSMTDRILQRHQHTIAFWAGVLVERRVLPKGEEVQVEEGLAEAVAFLAQRDLLPAEFDRDEVERLDLLCARLLCGARLCRRLAFHPALDHGLFLPRDEDGRDVRHALVLRLAHGDAVDGHTHEAGLPHLARERAERGGTFGGRYGELGEHCGDGGVGAEEVREVTLAVARADAGGRACAREREPVVDGGDVRQRVADVDYDAGECARGVQLRHGTVEDAEGGHVEALEEDLAGALVGLAREAGDEGEEDGRFVLDAAELEAREEDVLPVTRQRQ